MAESANSLIFTLPAMNLPHATLTIDGDLLKMRCTVGEVSEDIFLEEVAMAKLREWAKRHLELAKKNDIAGLLELGAEMTVWLEGSTSNLTRMLESGGAPMIVEFGVGKLDASERARAFLDAPWELLVLGGQHLALRADVALTVLRRIGKAQAPPAASPHRLSVVFMAAAPRGADNLNYEDEEAAILNATKYLGLDLIVEESGTLDLLAACVAREKPEVVQISCHGTLEPEPGLLLEDEIGEIDFVKAAKLSQRLAAHHPRLLFLSACETAESHAVLDSLAQSLVRSGAQAVLGWAAPVMDHEAALFASLLLRKLSEGLDLAQAFGSARLELAEHESLPESPDGSPAAQDWHLARLYFSAQGGGVLAKAGGPQRLSGRGQAAKAFLDVKDQKVPVAGELEFVGRRNYVQKILREFRANRAERQAGVFIHGIGRQGKSSLAARVARRMEHTHEALVLFGRYDAAAILSTFRERLGTAEVTTLVNDWLPRVEEDAAQLLPALTSLLEGPCCQKKPGRFPVLFIVDDFEQMLVAQENGPHRLRPELAPSIRSLLQAFQTAETDSRLLFTCRFEFTLPDRSGAEMTDHLLKVPLHGMSERESQKQAIAKLRQQTALTRRQQQNLPDLFNRLNRIRSAAQGNAGLQDLLQSLCLDDPPTCDTCLDQMEVYAQTGELPEEDQMRHFLEKLAIEALICLLSDPARELLRASTLFHLPVPVAVMQKIAEALDTNEHAIARLLALGLWESYTDLHDHQERALAVNALVRPKAGELGEEEVAAMAYVACETLFEAWGSEQGSETRRYIQDVELTRLGLLARSIRVLKTSTADALVWLEDTLDYPTAAEWARKTIDVMDEAGETPSINLLRLASERLDQVGLSIDASNSRERAFKALEAGSDASSFEKGALHLAHARFLRQQGLTQECINFYENAEMFAESERNKTVVIVELAQVQHALGKTESALELLNRALNICESLDEEHGRAAALAEIARIRARHGQHDLALNALHEVQTIYQKLRMPRSYAVGLGDIASIKALKGDFRSALDLHRQSLDVFVELGDARASTVARASIARILSAMGHRNEAEVLFDEVSRQFLELGDKRSWAVALCEVAKIQSAKGNIESALRLYGESLRFFSNSGEEHEAAIALAGMAQIYLQSKDFETAIETLTTCLKCHENLGSSREYSITLGEIASIKFQQDKFEEARQLQLQRIKLNRDIGDQDGLSCSLFDLAKIDLKQNAIPDAATHLTESYDIACRTGRLEGTACIGLELGKLMCAAGQPHEGLQMLQISLDLFQKLGRTKDAAYAEKLIAQYSAKNC